MVATRSDKVEGSFDVLVKYPVCQEIHGELLRKTPHMIYVRYKPKGKKNRVSRIIGMGDILVLMEHNDMQVSVVLRPEPSDWATINAVSVLYRGAKVEVVDVEGVKYTLDSESVTITSED